MLGTLIALAFALFVRFFEMPPDTSLPWNLITTLMILFALTCLIIQAALQIFAWHPLVKAGKNITPRIADLFQKDWKLRAANLYSSLYPLLTFLLVIAPFFYPTFSKIDALSAWILLTGIALDVLYNHYKRILTFLNPFKIVGLLTKAAKADVKENREIDLCDCIEAISEVGTKGVEELSTALPNDALNELQIIVGKFMRSSKSIAHPLQDAGTKKKGIPDKISYTLFFLFQRIELINDKAIERKLEPVCSAVITTLGKVALHAAKFDISLTSYPISVIGRCAKKAQENNLSEIGDKALITLLEVARMIIQETDVTYQELKEPFVVLIADMHEIAKALFKRNKETDIELFRRPFRLLKELFTAEKMTAHPDTLDVLARIDQVLAEWDALELVMKSIPPLTIPQESQQNEEK